MGTSTELAYTSYHGPLRPTSSHYAVYSTVCVGMVRGVRGHLMRCGRSTINGEAFCYQCKDSGGYTERLRQAQREARQRCLEAYPVCKRCGGVLTKAQVATGKTKHKQGWVIDDAGVRTRECLDPVGEPLAR